MNWLEESYLLWPPMANYLKVPPLPSPAYSFNEDGDIK